MIGGIDLGGTKIEARIFDDAMTEMARRRTPTPTASYGDMLDGLAAQIRWMEDQTTMQAIGLGAPGLIHPRTGQMMTANLPITGQSLGADISQRIGRDIAVINDCRAFTLSEAILGAGRDHQNVVGLVMGTGVAGGQAISGQIVPDKNGQHGEYGHLPLPAEFTAQYDLPLLPCGCGLTGCFENYLAGPGLTQLAKQVTGQAATTHDILSKPEFAKVRDIWINLVASLVAVICRTADPDIIVLGGGLGMVDGMPDEINHALTGRLLAKTDAPVIAQAQHGDASGALGAALFAREKDT